MRAVLFVGIGLLIHAVLSLAYVRTVGSQHRAVQLDSAFLDSDAPIDVLITGHSHARNAVDDRLLPNALNLAVGGEHFLKTWYRLRWLLARSDRKIGAVVLPLEPTSFTSWKADHFAPEYVWGRYVPFFELGMRKKAPWDYLGKELKARAAPYAGELETVAQYHGARDAFRVDPGLGRFDAVGPLAQKRAALGTARNHFEGQDYDDASLQWAFLSLVNLLERRGAEIVFVSYPVTREYAYYSQRAGARAVVRDELIPRIIADPDLAWLDFEDLYFGRNELFLDADHLNTVGQAHFTRALHAELKNLGIFGPERRKRAR